MRMRNNPAGDLVFPNHTTLYHGTTVDRLPGILKNGLRSGKEVGHQNFIRSKNNVFLTDNPAIAAWYCHPKFSFFRWHSSLDYVIIQVDVKGIVLHPDLDDAGSDIERELYLFNKWWRKRSMQLGGVFSEKEAASVRKMLEIEEFVYLEITNDNVLVAKPIVEYPIQTYGPTLEVLKDEHPELTSEKYGLAVSGQQFMCSAVPRDKIEQVFVSKTLLDRFPATDGEILTLPAFDEFIAWSKELSRQKYELHLLEGEAYLQAQEACTEEVWQKPIPFIELFPIL